MRYLQTSRGVTLLELLLAMFFLAVALVGLAASFPYAMTGVTSGGFQTTATLLAQSCLDMAKSMPYDRLPFDLAGACPANPDGYPGFTRSVAVSPGSPTATTTIVDVVVSFHDNQGTNDTRVVTLLAQ
jgi:type II secretory pathway pseudopilin PulG